MRLLDRLRPTPPAAPDELRGSLVDLVPQWDTTENLPDRSFENYTRSGMKSNGAVFAVMLARLSMFKQAVFQLERGNETDQDHPVLDVLKRPWPNGSTRDLLSRMIQHVDLAGNAYVYRPTETPDRLQLLRPDWVDLVTRDPRDRVRSEVFGYVYTVGGRQSGQEPVFIAVDEMAHFAPIPDPEHPWRGMSWLTPVARDINSHSDMSKHRGLFFKNAATPYLLIKVERDLSDDQRVRLRNELNRRNVGIDNAYSNLILTGGADATVLGRDLAQMDFVNVQAATETKIAAAGGVPPAIVGFIEGIENSSRTGYNLALRRFLDFTMRDLWTTASESLETILTAGEYREPPVMPRGWRLGIDESKVSALQQDARDTAQITRIDAQTVTGLVQQGFTPDSAVAAVAASDLSLLEHTGAVPTTLYEDDPAA